MPAVAAFTKPISAMNKKDLQRLAAAFNLPTEGNPGVKELRIDLKHYISAHKAELQADPAYQRLFPARRGRRARAPAAAGSDRSSRPPSPPVEDQDRDRTREPSHGPRDSPVDDADSARHGWGSWGGVQPRHDSPENPDNMHAGSPVMHEDTALHHLRSMDPVALARLIHEVQRGEPYIYVFLPYHTLPILHIPSYMQYTIYISSQPFIAALS